MPEVHTPMFISSRLMAALKLDTAGTLHIEHIAFDQGRATYHYIIEDADRRVLFEGNELRSGVGSDVDYIGTMSSLLSFLESEADSYCRTMGASEPQDGWQFNAKTAEWAYMHDDELAVAHDEIEHRIKELGDR